RDLLNRFEEFEIVSKIFTLKARMVASEICGGQVVGALDLSAEEAAADGTISDETDSKFSYRRQNSGFNLTLPQRILHLNRAERMNGMGATNGCRGCFGKSDVADFPLSHEIRHRANCIFDGSVRIDAVLIVKIDVIGSEPPQRTLYGLFHMSRTAIQP